MEAAARLSALHSAPPLLGELGLLADPTRGRMLACLDGVEMTVVELCDSLAAAAVDRLAATSSSSPTRAGSTRAATARAASTRSRIDQLDERSRRLWELVRESLAESLAVGLDMRRREQVLERRRDRDSQAFFSDVAGEWDALRGELFGETQRPAAPARAARSRPWWSATSAAAPAASRPRSRRTSGRWSPSTRSPEMLDVARSRLAGFGNVRVVEGRSRRCRSRTSARRSRSSSSSCTTWPIRRSRSPRSRACCGPAAGS